MRMSYFDESRFEGIFKGRKEFIDETSLNIHGFCGHLLLEIFPEVLDDFTRVAAFINTTKRYPEVRTTIGLPIGNSVIFWTSPCIRIPECCVETFEAIRITLFNMENVLKGISEEANILDRKICKIIMAIKSNILKHEVCSENHLLPYKTVDTLYRNIKFVLHTFCKIAKLYNDVLQKDNSHFGQKYSNYHYYISNVHSLSDEIVQDPKTTYRDIDAIFNMMDRVDISGFTIDNVTCSKMFRSDIERVKYCKMLQLVRIKIYYKNYENLEKMNSRIKLFLQLDQWLKNRIPNLDTKPSFTSNNDIYLKDHKEGSENPHKNITNKIFVSVPSIRKYNYERVVKPSVGGVVYTLFSPHRMYVTEVIESDFYFQVNDNAYMGSISQCDNKKLMVTILNLTNGLTARIRESQFEHIKILLKSKNDNTRTLFYKQCLKCVKDDREWTYLQVHSFSKKMV